MSAILFLHGALGCSSLFNTFIENMPSNHNYHAYDFPGHGEREIQHDFSIEYFANDLIEYIEKNELSKVDVFGYSMGGYVALYAAHLRPDLFNKIVTLATKFTWNEAIATKETSMLNPIKMEEKIPKFVDQLIKSHSKNNWKDIVNQTSKMLEQLGNKPPLTSDVLSSLQINVLLGVGDQDKMVSIDETLATFKLIPNASMYVLPGCNHPFEQVDTDILKYHLLKFIN